MIFSLGRPFEVLLIFGLVINGVSIIDFEKNEARNYAFGLTWRSTGARS